MHIIGPKYSNQRQQENKCPVHYDTRHIDLSHVSAGRVVILQIMAIREKEVCKMLNISEEHFCF